MNDDYSPDFVLPTEDGAAEVKNESAAEPAPFAAPVFEPSMLNPEDEPACEAPAPAEPVYAAPVYDEPKPEPPKPAPAVPVYDEPKPVPPVPAPPKPDFSGAGTQSGPSGAGRPVSGAEPEPGKKSRYAIMSSWGIFLQYILMSIPGLGILLALIWAVGGCRKVMRRNIARAYFLNILVCLLLLIVGLLVLRFAFPELFVRFFEYLVPGYTIRLY